ncbi:energy-coupling factor transporter transmembrane component T family protein [Metallosphaera hakonensis]|uniref:Energy-coupling factor transporter transmembrane protein EcfT n=1 Tax=Metallosphaera hakonensis JCM 8857 = DSM 7519 TaxID=1293036 RepID=A0A2U9IRI9_9CREN|nr:energy-coupling factor transporter transmembrane protein EcfT [Metallosphaera hakonensis]AWR98606.1 energy-coupling factor transporter transmembrane protein EcfT [Metallosphaera hakonensis JCM 8857 = DSM 7519]
MNTVIVNLISWFIVFYGVALPVMIIFGVIRIAGFKEITRFEKGEGLLYRLNPLTKVALGVGVMVVASVTIWWIGALLTLGISLLYLTLRDGLRKFVYLMALVFSSLIISTWSVAPYVPTSILSLVFPNPSSYHVIWTWPSYFSVMGYQSNLTEEALIYGIQIGFRVTAVLASSLLLALTTTTSDIFRMFTKLKVPLSLTFTLLVGVKTVPRIFELLDSSVKMQFIRRFGEKPAPLRPIFFIYGGILGIVPTMIYLLRGAKTMAISADTRGFRASPKRTEIRELSFGREDYVILLVVVGLLILGVLANLLGFGRFIPYVGS